MAPSPSTAIKENRGSPWVGARGFCSLLRYLPGEEAAIGHIHAEGAQRGGDQDGQHRYCQHQLTAGEAHGKGHRANGGLYGGLWRVGDHGEEPLPEGESGTQETDEDPGHTEDQRPQDDGQSGGAGGAGVGDVHGGAYQNKEEDLRGHPQLGILVGQTAGHLRAGLLEGDSTAHHGQKAREGDGPLDGIFQGHEEKGEAEEHHHFGGVPDVEPAVKGAKEDAGHGAEEKAGDH